MAYIDLKKKNETKRAWYRKNREKHSVWASNYKKRNPEKIKQLHRDHYLKNKDKYLESSKLQKLKDPIKYKKYMKEWGLKNKDRVNKIKKEKYPLYRSRKLGSRYIKKFGKSFDDLEKIYDNNNGLCYACGRPMNSLYDLRIGLLKPVVDHCHRSGKFRGLIHSGCNIAIGFVKEDPYVLRKLADYIDKFKQEE